MDVASIGIDEAIAEFAAAVPRLNTVSQRTAISFGFHLGTNKALTEKGSAEHRYWEVAAGYQFDVALMTVIRLYALLDRDSKNISYQGLNKIITRADVVEALIQRAVAAPDALFPGRRPQDVSAALCRFKKVYASIDWNIHGRLVHLRNLGVAHITPTKLSRSITYDELGQLVIVVTNLAQALSYFLPRDTLAAREDEIDDRACDAASVWRIVRGSI